MLLLPYSSDEQEKAARDTSRAVEGWAARAELTLITVTGLIPAAVKGGRLADRERTSSAPVTAGPAAGGIVVAVVGGAVLLFWGVRSGGRLLVERRRRRAELAARYADADAVVSEAA